MAKEIRIGCKGGKLLVKTSGFAGNECRDVTKRLKDRIGFVESDENTEEFYREANTETSQEAQQEQGQG